MPGHPAIHGIEQQRDSGEDRQGPAARGDRLDEDQHRGAREHPDQSHAQQGHPVSGGHDPGSTPQQRDCCHDRGDERGRDDQQADSRIRSQSQCQGQRHRPGGEDQDDGVPGCPATAGSAHRRADGSSTLWCFGCRRALLGGRVPVLIGVAPCRVHGR
nr:hypothetical protein [Nesterenkonia sp. AN1]